MYMPVNGLIIKHQLLSDFAVRMRGELWRNIFFIILYGFCFYNITIIPLISPCTISTIKVKVNESLKCKLLDHVFN